MKKVKCIDNCEGGLRLTVGKIYDVVEVDGDCYSVENDQGGIGSYRKYRFTDKDVYTLTLSEEEKDVLICALRNVGGCPVNSPRKFAKNILQKIGDYTVYIAGTRSKYSDLFSDNKSELFFNDFPPELKEEPLQEQPAKNSLQLKAEIDFSDAKKDIEELTELLKQVEVIKNRIFKEN